MDVIPDRRNLGRPSREAARRLTQDILATARAVFLEKGFERASMDEVAALMRISKRTLYARFPSKAALFEAMTIEMLREGFDALDATPHEDRPLREELSLLGRWLRDAAIRPELVDLYRVVMAEAKRFPHLAALVQTAGAEPALDEILQALRRARPDLTLEAARRDAELFLNFIGLGPLHRALTRRAPMSGADADELLERSVDLFLGGFSQTH
ncbi:TetR/AcrR family transcriptional regulator [Methylocella sp.]|uniref:TetR/AcrR family transcriptional regulator n=1 Tax=Methylocella sp. TaxID=1978226 RepID=UPI0037842FD8